MACITGDEVKEIMSGCTLTNDQIDPYINVAETYIERVFAEDTTVTTAFKTELKRWLTAHFVASIHYRMTSKERVGEAEVSYADRFGVAFNATPYGQTLLQLDTTGKLAVAGKKGARIFAIPQFEK